MIHIHTQHPRHECKQEQKEEEEKQHKKGTLVEKKRDRVLFQEYSTKGTACGAFFLRCFSLL